MKSPKGVTSGHLPFWPVHPITEAKPWKLKFWDCPPLGAVLPLYPLLFAIYQKTGRYDEIVEEFKRLRDEHEHYREAHHGDEIAPVATVTGLYRGTFSGLEPLTKDTPLTLDEVRRNPVFYEWNCTRSRRRRT